MGYLYEKGILGQAQCQRIIEQFYCSIPPTEHATLMFRRGAWIEKRFGLNCRPYWRGVYFYGKCHDFQHAHWDELIHTFDALSTSPTHRAYNENKLATELYDHFYQLKKNSQIHDNEWLPKFIDRYRLQMGYTPVCFISPLLMSRVNKLTNDKYIARLFRQTQRPQIQLYEKITREGIIALAFKFKRQITL